MERVIDRIIKLREWLINNKIIKSQSYFESICGLSNQYVKNLSMAKKGNPGVDTIAQIYNTFPMLNLEWMITGQGNMWKVDEISAKKEIINNIVLAEIAKHEDYADKLATAIKLLYKKYDADFNEREKKAILQKLV